MAARNQFSTVRNILVLQILIAVIIASGFLMLEGIENTLSPVLGCLVAMMPNWYFAYRLYSSRDMAAKQMVHSFYASESTKIILTACLFVLVFQIPGINIMTLLFGYSAVLSVFWFALILWRN